jgi:hypothetical protein
MIKWIVIGIVAVLVLAVVVIIAAGSRAPVRHVARVSLALKKSPAEVWAIVSDLATWPQWNTKIEKMERLPDRDGHAMWALTWNHDVMPSEVVEAQAPTETIAGRLVTRIADDKLPFGGTWTWEIRPSGVTITEDGFITNVFFRGMSSLFLGYTGTQSAYLAALANKLGEPENVIVDSVTFPTAPE